MPQRETSLKQLIDRVVKTIANWGRKGGYFSDQEESEILEAELTAILLFQHASFNSPVWFNCGAEEHPQCSACFINSVEDDMESILDLAKTEWHSQKDMMPLQDQSSPVEKLDELQKCYY